MTDTDIKAQNGKPNPWIKTGLEMGPLLIFFIAFKLWDIFIATGVIMVAMPIAMLISRRIYGHIALMQKVTLGLIMVMGGLTIYLEDATFVYMKPTIINALFATILTVGLLRGRSYLKVVMEAGFPPMHDKGWMIMTRNWAFFFASVALLNEFVWRNFEEETWVNFKVFGLIPIMLVFAMAQTPIMMKHQIPEEENSDSSSD